MSSGGCTLLRPYPLGHPRAESPGWEPSGCLLLRLPPPVPSKPPAALANGARCCFVENTFWSLLSEPSQPTPTAEKMCQDKWKISSQIFGEKKGKSKKNKRTAPKLPAFLMIAASRWGTQVLNVHPSAAQSQQAARAMPLRSGQHPGAPELPPRGWEEDDPALAFDGSQGACAGAGLPFIHNA